MKRELKKQIKKDEFVSWTGRAITWLRAHEREAKVTGAIVLAVALGWLGLSGYTRSRARAAADDFAAALRTFHAPVAGQSEPEPGQPKVFATEDDRHRQAAQEFAEVYRRYGSSAAGRRARYYEGLSRLELGQYDEAHKALSEVAAVRGGDEALAPELARLQLAALERRRGKVDEALKLYRQMADDASLTLPRDHVLMALSALEDARRLPEAREAYQRLADEFPESVYAPEARRRADYLKPATG